MKLSISLVSISVALVAAAAAAGCKKGDKTSTGTSRTSRCTTTLAGSRRVIGGGTSGALVYLQLPETDGLTLCRIEGTSLLTQGEAIELGLPAGASHLFDAQGKSFPRTIDALPGIGERRAS